MRLPPPPPPSKVLALYLYRDAGAYYRAVQPMRAIGGTWAYIWGDDTVQPYPDSVTVDQLEAAETVVLVRGGSDGPTDVVAAIRSLRERYGVKTVLLDYDDAIFEVPLSNPARPTRRHLASVRAAMAQADGIVVTGDALARHFRARTDKPVAVVPNLVDPRDWPAAELDEQPTLVLSGSPSHRHDWRVVLPALRRLLSERPDVRLRMVGFCPPEFRGLPGLDVRPWAFNPADYPSRLRGGWVGLAPLPDSRFNRGKSPIKAYEYGLSGMAVIGSPCQYADVLGEQRGTLIADDRPGDWYSAIRAYLDDPARRAADAARLRDHVARTPDAGAHASRLTAVYTEHGGDTWQS